MFSRQGRIRERLFEINEKFRQKGATSPQRAMTAEELGLPPRFEVFMQRWLGRLGIFIEVNGKYYLSEERLKQLEAQGSAKQTAMNSQKTLLNLRIIKVIIGIIFVGLLLVNIFIQSFELRLVASILLAVSLGVSVLQLYYLTRVRSQRSFF